MIEKMIRVNQAGEYGAKRIYEGQLSILGNTTDGPIIQGMADQEEKHLDLFNTLAQKHKVSATKLLPLWHILGYGIGVASALLGRRAAMACTVAVEEVIDHHYQEQLGKLRSVNPSYEHSLQEVITTCHEDELHHREIGLENEAQHLPGYTLFTALIKAGTHIAIGLSKRI